MKKICFLHSPFLSCGCKYSKWLVLDYWRVRSPHTKPVSCLQPNPSDHHQEVFVFAHMQATKDSVGRCLLGRKNNFEGCGQKKTTSIDNKAQRLDHQGIAEVLFCLCISCLLALLWLGALAVWNYPDPKWSSYPFIEIQTPHKGICLAQAQNPITTVVIDILWYV